MTPKPVDPLDVIVKGLCAWQKLPYDPHKVEVEDVITPGGAKAQIQALIDAARVDELRCLPISILMDGGSWEVVHKEAIDERIAQLTKEVK